MKILKLLALLMMVLAMGLMSCGEDEEPVVNPTEGTLISSFQFEVDDTEFLKVTFSNFSQNAESYAWDFGDGNTSTEEAPVHTYTEGGDYVVVLTASRGSESKDSEKTVELTDPNSELEALASTEGKVWKLSRDLSEERYPYLVGPQDRSQIWWALGRDEPLAVRSCTMEEEYIFDLDGNFEYKTNGTVWAEGGIWEESLIGLCVDEKDPTQMINGGGEDLSAWGSGNFTYDFDPTAGTLTVTGLGAHVGPAKVGTDAEYGLPQQAVTYKVVALETDGPIDILTLETTLPNPGYWQINLVSYDNPADEPGLGGIPPQVSFDHAIDGSTVTFTNTSSNVDSYSWDFGDGENSTEESPTHTYASDGFYTAKLTGMNSEGTAVAETNIIISQNSVFSAEVLTGAMSKTWKLKEVAGAYAVGSAKGAGDYFATSADDIMTRACAFNDTYSFDNAGVFTYSTEGDVWAETYMGVAADGCIDDADMPMEAAAWLSGVHSYSLTEATGDDPAYLTVKGTGAFIVLPKAYNGGEHAGPTPTENGEITYEVLSYVNDGTSETLLLTLDISENSGGGDYWTYILEAQ